jgi:hypothetical protein
VPILLAVQLSSADEMHRLTALRQQSTHEKVASISMGRAFVRTSTNIVSSHGEFTTQDQKHTRWCGRMSFLGLLKSLLNRSAVQGPCENTATRSARARPRMSHPPQSQERRLLSYFHCS